MTSMSVFDLPEKSECKAQREQQESHLKKLAATLNVDPVELIDQFHLFEPFAREHKANTHSSNFEAWANAVSAKQQKWYALALIAVLCRYGCWTESSSDVERGWP